MWKRYTRKKIYVSIWFCIFLFSSSLNAQVAYRVDWERYNVDILEHFMYTDGMYRDVLPVSVYSGRIDCTVVNENWIDADTTGIDLSWVAANGNLAVVKLQVYHHDRVPVVESCCFPFKMVDGQLKKLIDYTVFIQPTIEKQATIKAYANQSILATGNWIKISTDKKGVHKISYDKLKEFGISNPQSVAIYSNGGFMLPKLNADFYPDDLVQNPVYHAKDATGKDCVFFYSSGNSKISYNASLGIFQHEINNFTDSVFFFLTSDLTKSPTIPTAKITETPEATIKEYNEYMFIEDDRNNLIQSGRQFFGKNFKTESRQTYRFNLTNVVGDKQVKLRVNAAARSSMNSTMDLYINGALANKLFFPYVYTTDTYAQYANRNDTLITLAAKDTYELIFNYFVQGGGEAWVDFLSVNAIQKLKFNGTSFHFRAVEALGYNTVQFAIENSTSSMMVWDVTNPFSAKQMANITGTSVEQPTIGATFIDEGREIKEYVVFNPTGNDISEPKFSSVVKNQNIHGLPAYDMIMVSHPNFITQAERLAVFHREHDDMKVLLVSTTEVYNEFSSGSPDVSSIRNMARMFYDRYANSANPLKYLLLIGDGSYKNKNALTENAAFIPTYQSENSLHPTQSFVTDDFFALLDEYEGEANGYLDIGVGRFPCKTTGEASVMVDKTIRYSSADARGDWRNRICFIADDEDGNIHVRDTETLVDIVNSKYSGFFTDKIYFDAYRQKRSSGGDTYPDVTAAINRKVNEGVLILNYVGHANDKSMAHEDVLTISDINSWSNLNYLPIFVTATCEFGQFDDDKDSAGEMVFLNPNGGGVGLFTTTRVVYSSANARLSNNFYNYAFQQDEKEENLRMGDIMRMAKNATTFDTNKFNFVLLADPALRLAFPRHSVRTLSINNSVTGIDSVRIGALENVTIKGEVTSKDGDRLTDFNGDVSVIIYDKEMVVETLVNDPGQSFPFTFRVQNNMIYKGVSTVTNGLFEFSFIVPKDISYNIDEGKIIYYAKNETEDANGTTTGFLIGGTGNNPTVDNTPPEIEIYINNEQFKPGGVVSSNSLLLVQLFDDSGINTVGAGIGHDLIGILDGDYANPIVLNDFYSSKPNSYQYGTILYPLNNLSPGEHKIRVKVWDVQNNSAEKEIKFIVENGFKITTVSNWPNPVESYTTFKIEHTLPGEIFDVTISIFTLNGQKVYENTQNVGSSGKTINQIRWDTYNINSPLVNDKFLVYRIDMLSKEGLRATGTGKLLLKRKGN